MIPNIYPSLRPLAGHCYLRARTEQQGRPGRPPLRDDVFHEIKPTGLRLVFGETASMHRRCRVGRRAYDQTYLWLAWSPRL